MATLSAHRLVARLPRLVLRAPPPILLVRFPTGQLSLWDHFWFGCLSTLKRCNNNYDNIYIYTYIYHALIDALSAHMNDDTTVIATVCIIIVLCMMMMNSDVS